MAIYIYSTCYLDSSSSISRALSTTTPRHILFLSGKNVLEQVNEEERIFGFFLKPRYLFHFGLQEIGTKKLVKLPE